ncbi:MAG: tRNA lysidine(34) synthetase TilS [Betaproteobacteria bacterium]
MSVIRDAVREAIARHVPPGSRIVVALSGGRDSVVLLDALLHAGAEHRRALSCVHIHHGLSPNADDWAGFCERLCAERDVPFTRRKVVVARTPQASLEGEARRSRYCALAEDAAAQGARFVALAHHRDDQAETLLLQLLRGSGPHGLAAMATVRVDPSGVSWLRPLLDLPRAAIDAYAHAASLVWVEDESNARMRHRRNAVRHLVMPALAAVFPAPGATLARAAAHQADAALLADDLATLDAHAAGDGATLDRTVLAALPAHRARNLLRWFLRQRSLAAPSTARLAAMLDQLTRSRGDAHVRLLHEGVVLGLHGGRIHVHATAPPAFDVPWHGEQSLELRHGLLVFARALGSGLDAERLGQAQVRVRARAGGERFQLAPDRPRRALKAILRDAGIPVWDRASLPLVFCGDRLVAVAGVGVDAGFRAPPGSPGLTVGWHPRQS